MEEFKDSASIIEVMEYMSRSGEYFKDYRANGRLMTQYYVVKDELMYFLHMRFTRTGCLQYTKIPFLKRCVKCKQKADALYRIDYNKSWEYHLNMLPACESDIDIPEKMTIELQIRFKNRFFSFHIPEPKTVLWGLSSDELTERNWVPEQDYNVTRTVTLDIDDPAHIIAGMVKRLHTLKFALQPNKEQAITEEKDLRYGDVEIIKPQNNQVGSQNNLTNLRLALMAHFNLDELRTLCFDLNFDAENFPSTKEGFVRELLNYTNRRGLLSRIIDYCKNKRPNTSW